MDPLLSLAPLAAHIEHADIISSAPVPRPGNSLHAQGAHGEPCLIYTSSLRPRPQDIGFRRDVLGVADPVDFVEEATPVSVY